MTQEITIKESKTIGLRCTSCRCHHTLTYEITFREGDFVVMCISCLNELKIVLNNNPKDI